MGGGGNWELGTCDGNWEQPTNLGGSQLLRQVFGAASFWWGLLDIYIKGPLLLFTKGGLWHQRDGSSCASFLLEGQSKPVAP